MNKIEHLEVRIRELEQRVSQLEIAAGRVCPERLEPLDTTDDGDGVEYPCCDICGWDEFEDEDDDWW